MRFNRATEHSSASWKKGTEIGGKPKRTLEERGLAVRNAQGRLVTTEAARIRRSQINLKKVAWPLIDAFCPFMPKQKKQEIIKKLVSEMNEEIYIKDPKNPTGVALSSSAMGNVETAQIGIVKNADMLRRAHPGVMGHEFVHALGRLVPGARVAANSISFYFRNSVKIKNSGSIKEFQTEIREAQNLLDSSPIIKEELSDRPEHYYPEGSREFRKFADAMGMKAAEIEAKLGENGIGAGLFFIRLCSMGVPWKTLEEDLLQGNVPELKEWQAKHAEQWRKALKEQKRLS